MRKKIAILTCIFLTLGYTSVFAEEGEVIYRADFSGTKTLTQDGWTLHTTPGQSTYAANKGILRVTCRQNPRHDGFISRPIPTLKRGMLDFEANIAMENGRNKLGVSLTIGIYNISTWFHDYCKDWRRYIPQSPSHRLPGFHTEPVGHRRLTAIRLGRWIPFRIYFDQEKGIVEYYAHDMSDPVYIDYDAAVLGRAQFQGGELRIGSMGVTKGAVTYGIRNLTLRKMPSTENSVNILRTETLLFMGMSAGQYAVAELATKIVGSQNLRVYKLRTHGNSTMPTNQIKLDRLPSVLRLARAAHIVLVDMPAQPGDCLPAAFQKQILNAVENGARLTVLGGLFSLGKGGLRGMPLADILPVTLGDPWEVKRFTVPMPIMTAAKSPLGNGGNTANSPHVLWYHDCPVKPKTYTYLSAGGKPLYVEWMVGKGLVGVFLGVPSNSLTDEMAQTAFWQSPVWRHWLGEKFYLHLPQ